MILDELNIPQKKIELLRKKGIVSVESLLAHGPRKYYFFNQTYPLIYNREMQKLMDERIPIAVIGTVKSVRKNYKNGRSVLTVKVEEWQTSKNLVVNMIGAYQMYGYLFSCINKEVIVGGVMQYSPEYNSFSMLNPVLFSMEIAKDRRIHTVYSKISGISDEYYRNMVETAMKVKGELDFLPHSLLEKYKLPSFKETVRMLHHPENSEEINLAKKRIVFHQMAYFACKLELQKRSAIKETTYVLNSSEVLKKFHSTLPYELTGDQKNAIDAMVNTTMNKKRIHALVQGDVGCGKSVIAFSMMIAMAENSYQSVLMAPTTVLAVQHYKELSGYAEAMGFSCALLTGELKAAEKRKTLAGIADGSIKMIVGTHSCIGKNVSYYNLGLVITDEEHKFGVIQKQNLMEKAEQGVHSIIMSATPIPRTIACTMYGENIEVYSIRQMPSGRLPVKTAVCRKDVTALEFMKKQIMEGRQCYVVCPLVNKNEENERMEDVPSVEETYKAYLDYFTPYHIRVGVVTGKTEKQEQKRILSEFASGNIQVLIATTVIEVGINVPNANCIVITGAERFGLATLHQLRGRVGRGKYQSYCILLTSAHDDGTVNLEVLCRETDGFEIAKADLKNRGTGNILGRENSGNNEFIELLIQYPNMYTKVRQIAVSLCSDSTGREFVEWYEKNLTDTFTHA